MSKRDSNRLRIFAGRHSKSLASRVCEHLSIPLGDAKTHVFPDGEFMVKVEEDVRGRDCFVILSTCEPVNDNLVELLVFLDCLRRASARRVTVVTPYYGYGRQDRKDEGRVPITAKLVANLIAATRCSRVVAIDLHAAQIQGFFDLPMDHLSATPVFLNFFEANRELTRDLCVLSPDVGNVKVAEKMANLLGGDLAIINKRRLSGSEVVTQNLIGTVEGKTVLLYDDMISTAGTVCEAAALCMQRGAKRVIAAATHGVLCGPAIDRLVRSPIERLIVTDTIPRRESWAALGDRLTVLSVAGLLGDAINNIHHNKSVSALFRVTAGSKR
ncbi:MAG: ribose-phosphate pyrophosphokinase [Phycisphaeraceae bacterium]|nr:ribose-phosphate pyrophosphokinase [Phycisphaeraceae bacterium]